MGLTPNRKDKEASIPAFLQVTDEQLDPLAHTHINGNARSVLWQYTVFCPWLRSLA